MKVQKVQLRGNSRWRVSYAQAGKIVRKHFQNEVDARRHARQVERETRNALPALTELTDREAMALLTAHEAAREGGFSVGEAVEFFRVHGKRAQESARLGEALEAMMAEKEKQNLRPDYLRILRGTLKNFIAGRERKRMDRVTKEEIYQHIHGQGYSPVRINGIIGDMGMFWAWAVRNKLASENVVKSIPRMRRDQTPPGILTVQECREALRVALEMRPRSLAVLVLGLFGGLRTAEAQQTDWEHIDLDRGLITVSPEAAKLRARRLVNIQPNLKAWLQTAREGGASLPLDSNRYERDCAAVKRISGNWPRNGLRHSFCSYHLARWENAHKTALQAGNSPEMIFRHYRELVGRDEAEAFWGINP